MNDDYSGELLALVRSLADYVPGPEVCDEGNSELSRIAPEYCFLARDCSAFSVDGWRFLNLSASVAVNEQFESLRNEIGLDDVDCNDWVVSEEIRPAFWLDGWYSVFEAEGSVICIDSCPSHCGEVGQIIRVSIDGPERWLLARSFRSICKKILEDYKNGCLVLCEGALVRSVSERGFWDPD